MARSTKKGPFVDESLINKIEKAKASGKREVIKTWSRRSMVLPDFVGLTIAVHDGRSEERFSRNAETDLRLHSGQRQSGSASAEK